MDIFFQRCWNCAYRTFCSQVLCDTCKIKFHFLTDPKISTVLNHRIHLQVISFLNYRDLLVRNFITSLKSGAPVHKLKPLLEHCLSHDPQLGESLKSEIVIPMPSTSQRPHALLLAETLADIFGGQVVDCLISHAGPSQKKKTRRARNEISFSSPIKFLQRDSLLLVDDLLVTGSTLRAGAIGLGLGEAKAMTLAWEP